MINDSDEEVLYGSDTDELLSMSQQPQQQQQQQPATIPNLIDTRTDEESDWDWFLQLAPEKKSGKHKIVQIYFRIKKT